MATTIRADRSVPLAQVRSPHPHLTWWTVDFPRNRAHRSNLAKSMLERGWDGLPLLVHELRDGGLQAWMGMHRLLAAGDAGLATVPVVVATREQMHAAGFSDAELDNDPWGVAEVVDRLRTLADQRPLELLLAERENQSKRGF